MTSNLGTDLLKEGQSEEDRKGIIDEALRTYFRPEFLNRLDDIVIFHPLTEKDIVGIVDLQLAQVQLRLKERRIVLVATDGAKKVLAKEGFDPQFGARPLRRTIQRKLVDPLTLRILSGDVKDGSEIHIEARKGDIALDIVSPKAVPE
jgi:ATP-dependent Clp protease ATP-binding subunit ClpB